MALRASVGLVVIVLMTTACARKSMPPGQDWTVLPEEEALKLTTPCSRSFPANLSGYWRLADKDVERAESRFQEVLRRTLSRLSKEDRAGSPGRWYAQYAGFLRDGHRVVYVNAVADGTDWRKHAVKICDGGLMSFGAVLDLDRDAVDSFEFNGTLGGPIRLGESEGADAAQPAVAADGASPRR